MARLLDYMRNSLAIQCKSDGDVLLVCMVVTGLSNLIPVDRVAKVHSLMVRSTG